MNKIILSLSIFYVLFVSCSSSHEPKGEDVYSKINDAVVTIYTYDVNGKILSQGSGVVLNDKGWVLQTTTFMPEQKN